MIGKLTGQLLEKNPPQILVDCHGVGYEVDVPMSTFYQLPAIGQTVSLLTHFVVREDAQILYGFASAAEREAFRQLIRISGVGPRTALSVLSGMSVTELAQAVTAQEAGRIYRIGHLGATGASERLTRARTLPELEKLFQQVAFSILVRTGTRLNQLRLKQGQPAHLETRSVGVDLTGDLAGYRARRHSGVIDLDNVGIRDDVDEFIQANYSRTVEIAAARQFARAVQAAVKVGAQQPQKSRLISIQISRAVNCVYVSFASDGSKAPASLVIEQVRSLTTNTKERLDSYLAFAKNQDDTAHELPRGATCV